MDLKNIALFRSLLGFLWLIPADALYGQLSNDPAHIKPDHVAYEWKVQLDDNASLVNRINCPTGFTRADAGNGTFAEWLRYLPLKPSGSKVHLYNGEFKRAKVHHEVIDIDVGQRDLQQCADAAMRLRAEYLFSRKEFGEIGFNFTNGDHIRFEKWRSGYSTSVNGNKVNWIQCPTCNSSWDSFRKYMDHIFMYAGTASLAKELRSIPVEQIVAGDVFIQGGHPGHAVMVMDIATNPAGEKLFLLAQSYMPAQDVHILKNPNDDALSPWYRVGDITSKLITPEWTFSDMDLKRF